MSLKNLLIAFNGTESSEAALAAALQMQTKYDAHLTGIFAHAPQLERLQTQDWVPASIRDFLRSRAQEEEDRMEADFRSLASAVPSDRLHWISCEGQGDATVASYGRMYDVTIVGRYDSVLGNPEIDLHPDRIAQRSGRGVLTIPRTWHLGIPDEAIIAWDGQRTVTRALTEAMPLLESKTKVTVLRVRDRNLRGDLPGIDVEMALRRHGVPVVTREIDAPKHATGAEIVAACAESGAGLLVMGAYQRGGIREDLLGSTTQYVLENAALPILIAH